MTFMGGIQSELGGTQSELDGTQSELDGTQSEMGGITKYFVSHPSMDGGYKVILYSWVISYRVSKKNKK